MQSNLPEEQLIELCRRYSVRRLCLFGSAATGDFDPISSDFDFLVEFDPPLSMSLSDQYFGLWKELEDLLGREVDLVERVAIKNPYFLATVSQQERQVYAA